MTDPTDPQESRLPDTPTSNTRSDVLIMALTAIGCLLMGSLVTLLILWLFTR